MSLAPKNWSGASSDLLFLWKLLSKCATGGSENGRGASEGQGARGERQGARSAEGQGARSEGQGARGKRREASGKMREARGERQEARDEGRERRGARGEIILEGQGQTERHGRCKGSKKKKKYRPL
jgi:hypothetical protein